MSILSITYFMHIHITTSFKYVHVSACVHESIYTRFKPLHPSRCKSVFPAYNSVLRSGPLLTSVRDIDLWLSHKCLEFILPRVNAHLEEEGSCQLSKSFNSILSIFFKVWWFPAGISVPNPGTRKHLISFSLNVAVPDLCLFKVPTTGDLDGTLWTFIERMARAQQRPAGT